MEYATPNDRETDLAGIHREPHPEHLAAHLAIRCCTGLTGTSDVPGAQQAGID